MLHFISRSTITNELSLTVTSIIFFAVSQVLAYCHLTLNQEEGNTWDLQFDFEGCEKQNKDFLMKSYPNKISHNDFTGRLDRERMEMKDKENGTKGSSFIFAWWLKLDPNMKNTVNEFYHIFQIKTGGSTTLTKFPLATPRHSEFTGKNGFYLHRHGNETQNGSASKTLKANGFKCLLRPFSKQEGGYIRGMLKDEKGSESHN
jgi:hypothetical protein